MRLTELDPQFVRGTLERVLPTDPGRETTWHVDNLADAQGIHFQCPLGCGHRVLVWFRDRNVPAEMEPGPERWAVSGTGYADLTLAPSIDTSRRKDGTPQLCEGGRPGWHGFIQNGEVTGA